MRFGTEAASYTELTDFGCHFGRPTKEVMMERYPALDINCPAGQEEFLIRGMIDLAQAPWKHQGKSPVNRPRDPAYVFFHRDAKDGAPSATLCIHREPGILRVVNIVPDRGQPSQIPHAHYVMMLEEFDRLIAHPAVDAIGGMSGMEMTVYRLEDYFSTKSAEKLLDFLESSNAGDYGTHPQDQILWIDFLLSVYDEGNRTNGDLLIYCLQGKGLWPDDGLPRLASQYNFAMNLLAQSGRPRPENE